MKIITALLSMIYVHNDIFSQQREPRYENNAVVAKIKSECMYLVDKPSLLSGCFPADVTFELSQEFKNSRPPSTQYNKYGVKMVDISTIYRISFSAGDVPSTLRRLRKTGYFEYVEPLYRHELFHIPDDPLAATDQYWLARTHVYDAWDICKGDTNIVIGISDTGVDLGHEDLAANIKCNFADLPDGLDNDHDGYIDNYKGWNFAANDNNTQSDVNHHGTNVAGIVGAVADNGVGVAGAGYKCKILPLKICNDEGFLVNCFQSIVYAAERGCNIVNCSWGDTYYSQMEQDVVNYAVVNYDMLIVAAAGNSNSDIKYYPASYENVLSVGGTNAADERWAPQNSPTQGGSSYSYAVDVCAPATSFRSTTLNGYSFLYGGTSYASPIVAGCAGILRSFYPQFNANQITELIKNTADNIDTIRFNAPLAGKLGKGRINLYNALTQPLTPAIAIKNVTHEQHENIVTLNARFTNYLADVDGVTISVSALSQYASVDNAVLFSGDLHMLQSYVSENQLHVTLSGNTPHDYILPLKFSYRADGYTADELVEVLVNPGFVDITTDALSLTVAANGRFGFDDVNASVGNGFVLNNTYPLFYDCAIIAGSSAVNIYSAARQISDFNVIEYPHFVENPTLADKQVTTVFDDNNDQNPIGLKVIQNVLAWNDDDCKNLLRVDFQLVNNSPTDIADFYFGIFTDWDLDDPVRNISIFDDENQCFYCKNAGDNLIYVCVQLLSGQEPTYYMLPGTEEGDGIITLYDGLLDVENFYMISNSSLDTTAEPTDVNMFAGSGPFDIPAGDTVEVSFAFVAANSFYTFMQSVDRAKSLYLNDLATSATAARQSGFRLFPNPVTDILHIVASSSAAYRVAVYDVTGRLLFSAANPSHLDFSTFPRGLYTVKITSQGESLVKRISK